jgi:hypothetical protein
MEWRNTKIITLQAGDEGFGKYKAYTRKKKLKLWDDEIKLIVQEKNLASKKYLETKATDKAYKSHCPKRKQKKTQ